MQSWNTCATHGNCTAQDLVPGTILQSIYSDTETNTRSQLLILSIRPMKEGRWILTTWHIKYNRKDRWEFFPSYFAEYDAIKCEP